jgi:homocysteine S-methyltransferase
MLEPIREELESNRTQVVVSGCVGPRGDGYVPDEARSADEAEDYHRTRIATFADSSADMLCAITSASAAFARTPHARATRS